MAPVPMRSPAAPVPMRAPAVPAPASLVKDGFAWGLGNGIAHTIVGSIFRTAAPVAPATAAATAVPSEYTQCIKDFEDQAACRHLLPKGYGKE